MRKFLIFCLLATAAAPLAARPDDDDESRPARPDRSESRPARADRGDSSGPRSRGTESRPDRPQRPDRPDRPSWSSGDGPSREPVARPERPDRPARPDRTDQPNVESPGGEQRHGSAGWGGRRDRPAAPAASPDVPDSVRDWRPRDGRGTAQPSRPDLPLPSRGTRDWRSGDDRTANGSDDQPALDGRSRRGGTPKVSTTPRRWTQPPPRVRPDGPSHATHWRREWRDDHRYDWRHHRNRNRSIFHVGIYYDPFGWGYQRYNVGWRLWPNYYGRNYWLDDPWMYRLPPAYPGTQWIRYYDDALLVDTWTGEVIDVIYDFFW